MIVGLDASRNRSGGARTHLINMLAAADPRDHGIETVHVWTYAALARALPERPWLVVHTPAVLEKGLALQLIWQRFRLPEAFEQAGCDLLLNTDAGSISTVTPCVTMSRDMLSYEPGEIERFGWTKARLRLILLRTVQNHSLRRADGAIFLTRHAASVIQKSCGPLRNIAFIPHGVGDDFRGVASQTADLSGRTIRCVYISNAALHKHQWQVVAAVTMLRSGGRDVALTLVGGGSGAGQERLDRQIAISDPQGQFVTQAGAAAHDALPGWLAATDIFVFASSCENMPNTLVEAMAAGCAIACAARGPMPEVLGDGGVYFDPEQPGTIAAAIERLIDDPAERSRYQREAMHLAGLYSWRRCAAETWHFLARTAAEAVGRA